MSPYHSGGLQTDLHMFQTPQTEKTHDKVCHCWVVRWDPEEAYIKHLYQLWVHQLTCSGQA